MFKSVYATLRKTQLLRSVRMIIKYLLWKWIFVLPLEKRGDYGVKLLC